MFLFMAVQKYRLVGEVKLKAKGLEHFKTRGCLNI